MNEEIKTAAKRPYRSSIEVRRIAVDTVLKEVAGWLQDESYGENELREKLAKNVMNDPYEFARRLELDGWSPDYELVEILSSYDDNKAWEKVCRDYVSMFGVETPYKIGDILTYRDEQLEVTEVRVATAIIVARPIGNPEYALGGGYILNIEQVSPI